MNDLSVPEFAQRAGVTPQALYKQIHNRNSRLAPYIVKRGKRTFINSTALTELYNVEQTEPTKIQSKSTFSRPILTGQDNQSNQKATREVEQGTTEQPKENPKNNQIQDDYIDYLKGQIEGLQAAIAAKDEIIHGQSERLAELAQQIADLARNAQQITSQQQCLAAAATKPEPERSQDKPGLFARLFNRKKD